MKICLNTNENILREWGNFYAARKDRDHCRSKILRYMRGERAKAQAEGLALDKSRGTALVRLGGKAYLVETDEGGQWRWCQAGKSIFI